MDTIIILDKDEKQIGYIPDNVEWSIDGRTLRFGAQELDLAEVYLEKDTHNTSIKDAAESIRKYDLEQRMLREEFTFTFEQIKNNLRKFDWRFKCDCNNINKEKYPLLSKLKCNKIQYGEVWSPNDLLFYKSRWYNSTQIKSIGNWFRLYEEDLPLLKEVLNLITDPRSWGGLHIDEIERLD